MNKTQAGRLLTLAYFLKTQVKPENFDLRFFCDNPTDLPTERALSEGACGTSACALGWCPIVFGDPFSYSSVGCTPWFRSLPVFKGVGVSRFFGIDREEERYLFYAGIKRTPKQEARIIEKLVAKHGYTYAD